MINWKSILSTFDDKPTLMQWLKIVEKELQNAALENGAIYKHSLNISVSKDGESTTINIIGYFNYENEFTLDTLKQYLSGKGQLSIYNRVGNNGIIFNLIAYNNNKQNVDILGYSFSTSINALTFTLTSLNSDKVIKL